jgi:predicted methyltransferase
MKNMLASALLVFFVSPGLAAADGFDSERLEAVLNAQSDETRARYAYRNPSDTLEFFEIAPGSVVVEALPGGGWYSRILDAYLGPEGRLVGVDYAHDMFPLFGFFTEEQLKKRESWTETWVAGSADWGVENGAPVFAFTFGSMPEEARGTADTVLFIRALHNLARFEKDGPYLTTALQNAYDVLKPGGLVGVVQHHARADTPDEWVGGATGYLKAEFVIDRMQAAGFEYVGESDINANEKDQPGENDAVWRLPPTLATSRDDPELREQMKTIGESNRMTLKFRKPEETE